MLPFTFHGIKTVPVLTEIGDITCQSLYHLCQHDVESSVRSRTVIIQSVSTITITIIIIINIIVILIINFITSIQLLMKKIKQLNVYFTQL